MEGNRTCSTCYLHPVYRFCVCEGLPVFCEECTFKHEETPGFHFPLPLSTLSSVSHENQRALRLRLIALKSSQGELQANIKGFETCRTNLDAEFKNAHLELDSMREKMMRILETLERAVSCEVEATVRETTAHAYQAAYQPTSYLSNLVWTHSALPPIKAFEFQVKPDMQAFEHSLGIVLYTCIPELYHLNYGTKDETWKLKDQLEEAETETVKPPAIKTEFKGKLDEVSFAEQGRQDQELLRENPTQSAVAGPISEEHLCIADAPNYFASVRSNRVKLYDLVTRQITNHLVAVDFGDGGAYVQLDAHTLLCVGANPASAAVHELELSSCQLQSLPALNTPRCAPGIAKVDTRIYVFSGRDGQYNTLKTCERMELADKRWTLLSNEMASPCAEFTPCLHNNLLYLISAWKKEVETFNPRTETFNTLRIRLPAELQCCGSVCFMVNEELCLVTYWKQMVRWQVEKEAQFRLSCTETHCWSSQQPLVLGSLVLLANAGAIEQFSLVTYRFTS